MKILMIAIPNHHFFQWVNQMEGSRHEVFWFDVTDGGPRSEKISWVTQIKGWKLRWDYPLRSFVKQRSAILYRFIQKINERNVEDAFAKVFKEINPDIVHCFEMKLAGLPILSQLQLSEKPLLYSSWGSDMFAYKELGVTREETTTFLSRVDGLITDCHRDYKIAREHSFKGEFLGVFPGNGGIDINTTTIKETQERNYILIKGYEDGTGKAGVILEALTLVSPVLLKGKKIVIYSADNVLVDQVAHSEILVGLDITIHSRYAFIKNTELLKLMGQSILHIANSVSDGMPNALLEAMGMGAFPIQSNPGNVTQEVITNGQNGFLIQDPYNSKGIARLIEEALKDESLRSRAQQFNTAFIRKNYNRSILRSKIESLYHQAYNNHNS